MKPMDIAFQLLKELASPDGSSPNFTLFGNEDEDLRRREQEHIRALSQSFTPPQINTTNPTNPQINPTNPQINTTNPLSDNFFDEHAHERLTDRERTVDEDEEKQVRERITQAMQPYIDKMGNYNIGVPKRLAIRTHLLNEDRRPDETYSKSNGDSIVAIVRPHKKNGLKPELNTVMLRRSEMHRTAPQPFKSTAMDVDKVINAHGMSKKQMKRLATQRRYERGSGRQISVKSEPMDIAFQLLKGYPSEDEDMDEDMLYDYFSTFDDEGQETKLGESHAPEGQERLDEYGNIKDYDEGDYLDSINELKRYRKKRYSEDNRRGPSSEKRRPPMSLLPEDHPKYETRSKWNGPPIEKAFQLLKERKSPAAFAHKLEYDKQYQKDPKRVKYREQLNTERRKRGIYGKGGKDVSHTQGGKLTLESAHANRARHFKSKGTLRRVKVKK